LPIGLAGNVRLKRPVAMNTIVTVDDVDLTRDLDVLELRRAMEDWARGSAAPDASVAEGARR
jgi:predicted homoserine dehydrogenase-like protein